MHFSNIHQICGLYEGMTVRTRFPFGFSVTLMDERLQPVQRGGWDVMVNQALLVRASSRNVIL